MLVTLPEAEDLISNDVPVGVPLTIIELKADACDVISTANDAPVQLDHAGADVFSTVESASIGSREAQQLNGRVDGLNELRQEA